MATPRFAVRSVAIIGAGASGLAAARYIQAQGVYGRIVVYEQRAEVAGIWSYSERPTDQEHIPQQSPYQPPDPPLPPRKENPKKSESGPVFPSPAYDDLWVNIPHPLMGFTDEPIASVHKQNHPGLPPLPIYPHHQTIDEYLISYSQEVRHLIRFSAKVEDVCLRRWPRQTNRAAATTTTTTTNSSPHASSDHKYYDDNADQDAAYMDSWEIQATDVADGTRTIDTFDAVIVAHGHYDITFVPEIPNIRAFHRAHPGMLTHAKRFRNAELYRGKKVVVVGNAASGIDIAHQVNAVARPPLLLSVHTPTSPENLARLAGAEEVPQIAEFLVEERGVRLADGRVERDLDAVVFCTGYLFTLPFLEKAPPPAADQKTAPAGLEVPLLTNGRRVHRLYDDLFHIDHPTLAFLALPIKVIPFPLAQSQAAIVARTWANTLPLPSRAAMEAWECEAEKVRGPSFHVWPSGADGTYINATYKRIMEDEGNLAAQAGKEPPRWDDYLLWMRTVSMLAKGKFEDTGRKATSLEELGFHYGGGEDKAGEDGKVAAGAAAAAEDVDWELVDAEL